MLACALESVLAQKAAHGLQRGLGGLGHHVVARGNALAGVDDASGAGGLDQRCTGFGRRHLVVAAAEKEHLGAHALHGLGAAAVAVAGEKTFVEDVLARVAAQHTAVERHAHAVGPGARPQRRGRGRQAKPVKAWLKDNEQYIEVFYLPSYSPELNPDEMLNANLKAAVTSKAPNRRKGQLKLAAVSHMRHLQKSPQKVKQFFQKDCVKYAA